MKPIKKQGTIARQLNAQPDTKSSPNLEFIQRFQELTGLNDQRRENRRHRREERRLSLRIQPLDLDFCPDGESFWVVSKDVSYRGIGFINPEPITHEYVRIGIMDENLTVIARICHSTSIGLEFPLYLIGASFLQEYYKQ